MGDPVWVSLWGKHCGKHHVEKVGRKYLHVYGHQFDVHTGRLAGGYSGQCETEAQHEEESTRRELVVQLRTAAWNCWRALTVEQLGRMVAITQEKK